MQQDKHELSARAQTFLGREKHKLIIDGVLTGATRGDPIASRDPSTGKVIGYIEAGQAEDIDRAVKAARAAYEGPWSKWSPYDRQALLFRIHSLLTSRFSEVAEIESMDIGVPITRSLGAKAAALRMVQFFAAMALSVSGETLQNGLPGDVSTMTIKAPVGVVGGIIPWNGSLTSIWWIVGAVIATGCTTVLKPATEASLSVLYLVEMLHEAGLPNGVVNVVTGHGSQAGDALARHPGVDRIAFTGSTETGRQIIDASKVNIKRLQLELGGKSPDIIFADANLDKAVPGAAMGVFANSGQICYAGTRILVQRSIVGEFTDRLSDFVQKLRVGPSLDTTSQLGPVISEKHKASVMSYIDIGLHEGAKLATGGAAEPALAQGYFVKPTVFTNVNMNMRIAQEEIFGPVVSIIPFDTTDEAISIGNKTEYGLAGAVWSENLTTALNVVNRIHAGVMWVNCYGLIDPLVGFNGAKMSGYGAKGSLAHLDTYLYTKSVYIQR